jgi:hypothetical protein
MFPDAGTQNSKMCSGSGGRLFLFVFVAMLMVFDFFPWIAVDFAKQSYKMLFPN